MRRITWKTCAAVAILVMPLVNCADEKPPATTAPLANRHPDPTPPNPTAALVRQLAAGRGVIAMPRKPYVRPALAELGRMLAFDKVLSGNRDISCMTCHMPQFATGDDKSLSVGEGGVAFGPDREHPDGVVHSAQRAAGVQLAAMQHLFWDGRVEVEPHGQDQHAGRRSGHAAMQRVFEFGPISAIGMFPVDQSRSRCAAVPRATSSPPSTTRTIPAIWAALMNRLGEIPEYRDMFERRVSRARDSRT